MDLLASCDTLTFSRTRLGPPSSRVQVLPGSVSNRQLKAMLSPLTDDLNYLDAHEVLQQDSLSQEKVRLQAAVFCVCSDYKARVKVSGP